MNITILGAGLVGSTIAQDLSLEKDFQITVIDIDEGALKRLEKNADVSTSIVDLSAAGKASANVSGADLVVTAVPGSIGYSVLEEVIDAGINVVDIGFFSEDPFELDDLAKERGVTAVVDCGVAPGLANIILTRTSSLLDQVDDYTCYVGGLPILREKPYEYKAVFSPSDVLEEYVRPARLVENGKCVVKPALSEVELIDFPGVGTLEAFNTDGLRTLIKTQDIPNMKEKTLRFPGHAQLMWVFREGGFFSNVPIQIKGTEITPLEITSRLMFDDWRLKEGEQDFTVMQILIEGVKDGERMRYSYYLYDQYDISTGTTSMARTTGYTCSIVARQVARGVFRQVGICPPEFIGACTGCYEDLVAEYNKRNIQFEEEVQKVN